MIKTNKQIVFDFFDGYAFPFQGSFYGRQLKEFIFSCTGREPYTETVLKYTREYCKKTGAKLICLSKQKSKYNFIPGSKMLNQGEN